MLTVAPGTPIEQLLIELAQGRRAPSFAFAVRLGEGSSLTLLERQSGELPRLLQHRGNLTLEAGAQLTHQRLGLAGGEGRWLSQHAVTVGSGPLRFCWLRVGRPSGAMSSPLIFEAMAPPWPWPGHRSPTARSTWIRSWP